MTLGKNFFWSFFFKIAMLDKFLEESLKNKIIIIRILETSSKEFVQRFLEDFFDKKKKKSLEGSREMIVVEYQRFRSEIFGGILERILDEMFGKLAERNF